MASEKNETKKTRKKRIVLTDKQKKNIVHQRLSGDSLGYIAQKYNVAKSTIKRIVDHEAQAEEKAKATKKRNEMLEEKSLKPTIESHINNLNDLIEAGVPTMLEMVKDAKDNPFISLRDVNGAVKYAFDVLKGMKEMQIEDAKLEILKEKHKLEKEKWEFLKKAKTIDDLEDMEEPVDLEKELIKHIKANQKSSINNAIDIIDAEVIANE